MKFLVFTDLHNDKEQRAKLVKRALETDVEFIVCCGDISTFGRGLRDVLNAFSKCGKKMYVIPGNHEEAQGEFDVILRDYSFCINLHKNSRKVGDYYFIGYGGGGFAQQDAEFRTMAREWYGKYKEHKTILVTHGPPFNTTLDDLTGKARHVGNKDYRKFIERIQPRLAISGHLHETVGKTDKIGKTTLLNPGWEGMVIELK